MKSNTPSALVRPIRQLSPIWLVPFVVLIIAAWLALEAWRETGPSIKIVFDSAAGMQVGKTEVRYRDVVVGKVADISLAADFEQVNVTVDMDPSISEKISVNSRFWVVTPRISLSGVSGLSTLLSGVYIEMDPGQAGKFSHTFQGLSEAPAFRSYDQGSQYQLYAKRLGSLDVGSGVYHRDVKVGWVTGYRLLTEKHQVRLRIFIEAPYDSLVNEDSNFWNVSGFGVNLDADGVKAKVASLSSLVAGGLAFDSPQHYSQNPTKAAENTEFYLFANKEAVQNGSYTIAYPYELRFQGSVRGLKVGAPVEYKGMQVGEVTHMAMEEKDALVPNGADVTVRIAIQPERLSREEVFALADLNAVLNYLVSNGMRAQLKTSSLITGALYVDLVPSLEKKNVQQGLRTGERYAEIPTSERQYQQLSNQISDIIGNVQNLPFESVGTNVDQTLQHLNQLVKHLKPKELAENSEELINNLTLTTRGLDAVLTEFSQTLSTIDQTIAADSRIYNELVKMIQDVGKAADAFEQLTEELNRHPNSLVVGRGKQE